MGTLDKCSIHEMMNCAICNGDDKRFQASTQPSWYDRQHEQYGDRSKPKPVSWFIAEYDGRCFSCGLHYEPGDEIAVQSGRYYCEDCGHDLERGLIE